MATGAASGAFDYKDAVFLFSDSYDALKRCVEEKKEEGYTSLRIIIRDCEDCDVNNQTYQRVKRTVSRVSFDCKIGLRIEE